MVDLLYGYGMLGLVCYVLFIMCILYVVCYVYMGGEYWGYIIVCIHVMFVFSVLCVVMCILV